MNTKLTIVTIGRENINEVIETIKSVDIQSYKPHEHIMILSKFKADEKKRLECMHSSVYRTYLYDVDSGLYNAMNIGIKKASGDLIYFLNSGDKLASSNCIKFILNAYVQGKCMAFSTMQTYKDFGYIRPPIKNKRNETHSCAHQGFVAPLSSSVSDRMYYDESNEISSDFYWMEDMIKKYGLIVDEKVLAEFSLGGTSNTPSLKTIISRIKSKCMVAALKNIPKFILYKLVKGSYYHHLIAIWNGYKIVDFNSTCKINVTSILWIKHFFRINKK